MTKSTEIVHVGAPSTSSRDLGVAFHEAGHAVMGCLVGMRLGLVTIDGGATYGGATVTRQILPEDDPEAVERADCAAPLRGDVLSCVMEEIMMLAAGPIAEELALSIAPGRRAAPLVSRLLDRPVPRIAVEYCEPADQEVLAALDEGARSADPADLTDEAKMWTLAMRTHRGDVEASQAFLVWLSQCTRNELERHYEHLERLASALIHCRSLDGVAVEVILHEVMRPVR